MIQIISQYWNYLINKNVQMFHFGSPSPRSTSIHHPSFLNTLLQILPYQPIECSGQVLFVWVFLSPTRDFFSQYGDMSIANEGLQILPIFGTPAH